MYRKIRCDEESWKILKTKQGCGARARVIINRASFGLVQFNFLFYKMDILVFSFTFNKILFNYRLIRF